MARWTKLRIVQKAYRVFGLGPSDDLTPEQLDDAKESLDTMLAQWDSEGIHLGANLDGEIDADCGVDLAYTKAVYMNLGVEMAASIGHPITPENKAIAERGYSHLKALAAVPIPMVLPDSMPVGAGYKSWRNFGGEFFSEDTSEINTESDGELEFE